MSTATAEKIADIYGRSLMDLAAQSQSIDAVADDLDAVSMLLEQNPDLRRFSAPLLRRGRQCGTWSARF